MKMAKASKDDIDRCRKLFQFIEEYMDHGTFTPENDETEEESVELTEDEFVRMLKGFWGGRFKPAGVDCSWRRVVLGCDILIDNVCDPDSDTLEWKPELAEKLNR